MTEKINNFNYQEKKENQISYHTLMALFISLKQIENKLRTDVWNIDSQEKADKISLKMAEYQRKLEELKNS